MPAPAGNTNALKWTYEKTEALISEMEELVREPGIVYIGQALGQLGTCTKQWQRLRDMYATDEELMYRMDVIDGQFESILVVGNLLGRFKGNAAQFVLKNKYNWSAADKKDIPPPMTPEEQEAVIEEQVNIKMKEKIRMIHKVMDYNETHPERPIPLRSDYLDVQPPGPCIRHSGDFYTCLY